MGGPHCTNLLARAMRRFHRRQLCGQMWGKDKFGSDGRYASILKEVVYPIVGRPECQKKLRETRLGRFFELDKSFMCAGGIKGVDTCKGDGGSPLSCKIQGRNSWVQAGIVSWGIGCGEEILWGGGILPVWKTPRSGLPGPRANV